MSAGHGAAKIYTKGGDKGKTSLIGGARVAKSDARLDAYGTIDELNCIIGILALDVRRDLGHISVVESEAVEAELQQIQNELFNIGSQLACEDQQLRTQMPAITNEDIAHLERSMDTYSTQLVPLKNFILPGGSRASAQAHVARTVARRAERLCVAVIGEDPSEASVIQYVNRLSDYLFVLARHLNRLQGISEPVWAPKGPK